MCIFFSGKYNTYQQWSLHIAVVKLVFLQILNHIEQLLHAILILQVQNYFFFKKGILHRTQMVFACQLGWIWVKLDCNSIPTKERSQSREEKQGFEMYLSFMKKLGEPHWEGDDL